MWKHGKASQYNTQTCYLSNTNLIYSAGNSVYDMVLDTEAQIMVHCGINHIKLWDLRMNAPMVSISSTHHFTTVAYDHQKQRVITGSQYFQGTKELGIYQWNLSNPEPILIENRHTGSISNLIYDRTKLITSGNDSSIIIREYNDGHPRIVQTEYIPENTITRLKITPSELYAAGGLGILLKLSIFTEKNRSIFQQEPTKSETEDVESGLKLPTCPLQ